jgi:two-component system chemotaxis sensor kinase CheA
MTGKPDPMAEIRASFFVECEELLENLQDALNALDEGDDDPETINVAFRAVHSIKGGAGAFGLNALVAFAHRFETVMDAVRSGKMAIESQGLKLFFLVADRLADHVAAARQGGEAPAGSEEAIVALEGLLGGGAPVPEPEDEITDFVPMSLGLSLDLAPALPDLPDLTADDPSSDPASAASMPESAPEDQVADAPDAAQWIVRMTPLPGLYASGNEPLYLLRALTELGEVAVVCDHTTLPPLSSLDPGQCYLSWTLRVTTAADGDQLREVFEFVEDVARIEIEPLSSGSGPGTPTDTPGQPPSDGPVGSAGQTATPDPAASAPTTRAADGSSPAPEPSGGTTAALSATGRDGAPDPAAPPPGPKDGPKDRPTPSATAPTRAGPFPDKAAMPPSISPPALASADRAAATPRPDASQAAPAGADPGAKSARGGDDTAAPAASEAPAATVRVDVERIDKLVNLVGELVINQAMLQQSIAAAGLGRDSTVMNGLESFMMLTRDIQDSVMVIRAQPVKPLFQRMARIVREASALVGKTVRLKTEGDATEVDKTVIERLADPLTHMIRNAVDHGLETSDRRTAAGKPIEGVITLRAQHRSGRVVIDVADDGGGIDREKVLSIAKAKGLVAADAELADGEIDSLLFLPGFSTASTVSNLSGRGVGMDVVKRAIQALGGRITIETRRGEGTCFSISLPLTLAVLDGMIVRAAGETLVVPLSSIVETAVLEPDHLRPIGASTSVIHIRGDFVPLLDLGAELGFRARQARHDGGIILLTMLESGERAALIVDEIVEQRQVVIKGLHHAFGQIPGIAAATILGDGQIALILDPADLVAGAGGRQRPAYMALAG